jgi:hypothetical protein
MRLLAFLFVTGSLALVGCAGDSSSLMSVWNDSGVGGGQPPAGGAGGAGGGGAGGGGIILVPGGERDVATAQCITTTGGACMFSSDYLDCIKVNCGPSLSACYNQPGASASAAGGACLEYANCMLGCPCDGNKSTCENGCLQSFASTYNCGMCIVNLGTCASKFNCPSTPTCATLGLP